MKREIAKISAAALLVVAMILSVLFVLLNAGTQLSVAAVPGLTGDVEVDFDPALNPDVFVLVDPGGVGDVGVPADLVPATSGHDMRDVRFVYDAATDQLFVGLNFDGVGGDPEGNGNSASGTINSSAGGTDLPAFGGTEAFAVIIDTNADGAPDVIAGVSDAGDLSTFSVNNAAAGAHIAPGNSLFAYGTPIPGALGQLPTDTSSATPDLEFSIANFSTLLPNASDITFGILAFAGSGSDGGIGEEYVGTQGLFEIVSLATPEPAIDLEKNLFGADLDDPGVNLGDVPNVPVGVTITFQFIVTNTGNLDLADIDLDDNVLGPISCPSTTLLVGEEMTCEGDHVVTEGLTRNEGSVTAQPVGPTGIPFGDPVGDTDPAHHRGFAHSIVIEKDTNGDDADDTAGPNIAQGDAAVFTYVVTNPSALDIADAIVTDSVEGVICTIALLPAGGSDTCTAQINAGLGAYENNSTVVGQPVTGPNNDVPAGPLVNDEDPSHHYGVCAETFDGPALYKGSQTVWETGLIAGDNSTIQLITSENGSSPNQPNEQVYVEVGGVQYGPSPAGLGTITFDITTGGPVTVLHISEVDSAITGSNSVVPSLCGTDLGEALPLCVDLIEGPALWSGAETVWNTGLTAESGSTIRLVTTENGASPAQPNEQVYVEIAGVQYGPSAAGLGEIEIVVGEGGPVTVLHYSVVTGDTSSPNSVVPALCGPGLTVTPPPVCIDLTEGPALWAGAETVWNTGLTAQAGSTLRIVTTENGASPAQPNEQVYIQIGADQYGPTPAGLGELEITVTNTGPVTVLHYSEVSGDGSSPNSVVPAICGTELAATPVLCSDLIEGPALWSGAETVWSTGLTAVAGEPIRVVTTENGASPEQPNEQVYVKVGEDIYGPSPAGLGAFEFTPTAGGEVTVLHYSVVSGDISSSNSVVPALCGPGLSVTPPACVNLVEGPALYHGADTVWHTNYFAKDNSKIRVVVGENGDSPDQPNERVFVQINGETIGMTPSADGEATFDVVTGGPVTIVHYSVVTGDTSSPNSVVPSVCGSDWVKIEGGLSCELPDGTPVTVDLDGNVIPASFDGADTDGSIKAIGSADTMANFVPGTGDTLGGLADGTSNVGGFSLLTLVLTAAVGAAALSLGAALGARRS